jgi:hypothetical protein
MGQTLQLPTKHFVQIEFTKEYPEEQAEHLSALQLKQPTAQDVQVFPVR